MILLFLTLTLPTLCIVNDEQAIYEQLFDLIVERINVALDPAAAADVQNNGVDLDVDVLSIGKLSCLLSCLFVCISVQVLFVRS